MRAFRYPSLLAILTLTLLVAVGSAGPTSSPAASSEPEAVRAFRYTADGQAPSLLSAAQQISGDSAALTALAQLLERHMKAVDAEAQHIVPGRDSAGRVLARSRKVRDNFEEKELGPWLDAHADVHAQIQKYSSATENLWVSLSAGTSQVMSTVQKVGLPTDKEASASKILGDAHDKLVAMDKKSENRLTEIQKMPEGDERQLAEAANQAEMYEGVLKVSSSTFNSLKSLFPPEQTANLEEALAKLEVRMPGDK